MTSSATSSVPHAVRRRSNRQRFSRFRGVRRRSWGSWVAEVRVPNSPNRLWLGSYQSIHQAARAYDVATLCLRGPSAGPLNLPTLPIPTGISSALSLPAVRDLAVQEAARLRPPSPTNVEAIIDDSNSSLRPRNGSPVPSNFPAGQLDGEPTSTDFNPTDLFSCSSSGMPQISTSSDAQTETSVNKASLLDVWFSLELRPELDPMLQQLVMYSLYRVNREEQQSNPPAFGKLSQEMLFTATFFGISIFVYQTAFAFIIP
ncbi:hypothetical protein KP509_30G046300 [Ceratopteris richardii]|uniref:AP2/ERF domain-containing protein n=1 Tax=Ceratopteris richardii TaxID=49495 RepID=A0A8T2R3S7_CERRI|nr:hypothetical protein KP509_30G046300 [Ceratopteris richardii]